MSITNINLFINKNKQYKSIILSFTLFIWFFLNQSDFKISNLLLLNEPIFCKITYFLNDSTGSIYFAIVVYFIFWRTLQINRHQSVILIAVYLYIAQISNHNKNLLDYVFFTKLTNHTLINGLLLIHPILLYIALTSFVKLFFNRLFFKKSYIQMYKNIFQVKQHIYVYASVALFLGCYWAQQETNWGGWWNWDPVELIAFVLWIYSIYYVHIFYKNVFIFSKYFTTSLVITTISYFLSRYDILNSIHSFASSSKSSKYLELKALIIYYLVIYFFSKKRNLFYCKNNIMLLLTILISTCTVYNIILQFLDISKNNFDYQKELILILLLYFVYFFKKKFKLITTVFYLYFYSYLTLLTISLINLRFFLKHTYKSHLIIIYGFLLMILFSHVDVFIKSYEYKTIINYVFNLNHKWFSKIYLAKTYNDYQSYIQSKTGLYVSFDLKKRFFYQTLLTNFSINQNYVNINTTLIFFQQKLFLKTFFLTWASISLLVLKKKLFFKAV